MILSHIKAISFGINSAIRDLIIVIVWHLTSFLI